MNRIVPAVTILIIILLLNACQSDATSSDLTHLPAGVLVVKNGTILDATGGAPIPDGLIAVQDNMILAVGPQAAYHVPEDAQILDAQGGTIMPGIIDAHTHVLEQISVDDGQIRSVGLNLNDALQAGLTTIRDLGSPYSAPENLSALRLALELNGNTIPNIVLTGPILSAPGGPMMACCSVQTLEVTDAEAARRETEKLLAAGVDGIKIVIETGINVRDTNPRDFSPSLTPGQIQAITQVAHEQGNRVSAHVSDANEAQAAIDAGVDELAHWPFTNQTMADELVQHLVENNIPIVSTFIIFKPDPEDLRRFLDAGGIVALGTDAPGSVTLGMPLGEMQAMLLAGMTPIEIITAATAHAAQSCGLGNVVGTLESGKQADIIVVKGDPLEDINVLRDVIIVIKGGDIVLQP